MVWRGPQGSELFGIKFNLLVLISKLELYDQNLHKAHTVRVTCRFDVGRVPAPSGPSSFGAGGRWRPRVAAQDLAGRITDRSGSHHSFEGPPRTNCANLHLRTSNSRKDPLNFRSGPKSAIHRPKAMLLAFTTRSVFTRSCAGNLRGFSLKPLNSWSV